MTNNFKKLIALQYALHGVLFFIIIFFNLPAHSAQLIDKVPIELKNNWQTCLHFESQQAICNAKQLPEKNRHLPENVTHQTYTKEFIPNSNLKGIPLGIWLPNIDDVDKIYINKELIGKTGQFSPTFESGFRLKRLYLIPNELIHFNQFNQIEIHTFSSRNLPGIQTSAPIIGNYLTQQSALQGQNYSYLIVASILLLLTIFPVFYFIVVKGNQETVYFMLFLFAFSLVSIARSHTPIDLGLDLSSAFKMESFMLVFGMLSISLFLFSFFDLELRRIYTAGLYFLGISGLILIVWPYAIYLRELAEINYFLLLTITFFVNGSALIIAIHKQRKYALTISITCIGGWILLLYDAIMQANGLFEMDLIIRPRMMPLASAIVGVVFTLTLTHKYWHFFKGSTYDHLTGTLLRPAFFQRLSEEMDRCRRSDDSLMIAVVEIQQAKKISMNYGYSIGNHLLTTVSQSLTKVLRPYDLICRFSDEQFCIAATINNRQDAEQCIQRIYEELINIEQPINSEVELYVDARIGSVIYNEEQHLSVSHIIQDANYALSKAKSQSRQSYLLIQNFTMPV
ncbi:diguanylate cyclase domain-containing protein [Aliikangiella sp. IMCC44359]|uniref:diguanylate cyclase domain-containing protein n=1 Tax=Aliikangiella sp. IMCC44359 TaxID=3459125 RepID=UPI00403AF06A